MNETNGATWAAVSDYHLDFRFVMLGLEECVR
jgi:hypothetical protein